MTANRLSAAPLSPLPVHFPALTGTSLPITSQLPSCPSSVLQFNTWGVIRQSADSRSFHMPPGPYAVAHRPTSASRHRPKSVFTHTKTGIDSDFSSSIPVSSSVLTLFIWFSIYRYCLIDFHLFVIKFRLYNTFSSYYKSVSVPWSLLRFLKMNEYNSGFGFLLWTFPWTDFLCFVFIIILQL